MKLGSRHSIVTRRKMRDAHLGIKIRGNRKQPPYRKVLEATPERLKQLYDEGATLQSLADRFGLSTSAIWQRLRKVNTKFRQGGRPPKFTLEQLEPVRVMVVELGLSDKIVSMVCGVSESAVQSWRNRLGLSRRVSRTRMRCCGEGLSFNTCE